MNPVTREEYDALLEIVRKQNVLIEKLYYQNQRFLGIDDEQLEKHISELRGELAEAERHALAVTA